VDHYPDFICRKQGGSAIWIDRNLIGGELPGLLQNPDALFNRSDAEIIKDQRKIKVARLRLVLGGETKYVYVKRYNVFSWRYSAISFIMRSRAFRSLQGAGILFEADIATARPVAATECRRWGALRNSFFLSEEISGGKTVDEYWRELTTSKDRESRRRRRRFLRGLALLFRKLHGENVYHNDLKDANILVVPGQEGHPEAFFLLDLEGLRRYRKLNRRRRVKNLVQLNRTFGLYLRRSDKLFFIKNYLADSFTDRREARCWITAVLEQSRKKDRQKLTSRDPAAARAGGDG
jgi:serine/threonine protein kinase